MTKKIIYFTAGKVATSTEIAEIAVLNNLTKPGYKVAVRNGSESDSYGSGIESNDLVAGTIPTAFNSRPKYGFVDTDKPSGFNLDPKTVSLAVSATKQLTPLKITGTDLSNVEAALVTSGVTYASSDATKATVSAGGLITGVAAGTCTITATYTLAEGKTMTATCAVTVTA